MDDIIHVTDNDIYFFSQFPGMYSLEFSEPFWRKMLHFDKSYEEHVLRHEFVESFS